MRIFLDASCIIAMARSGRLAMLQRIVDVACVTAQVRDELVAREDETTPAIRAALADWIAVTRAKAIPEGFLRLGLDAGEASLIAASGRDDLLVLDDRQGRALARSLGRNYTGLAGLLLRGVDLHRITVQDARAAMEGAERRGFWVSANVRREFEEELRRMSR